MSPHKLLLIAIVLSFVHSNEMNDITDVLKRYVHNLDYLDMSKPVQKMKLRHISFFLRFCVYSRKKIRRPSGGDFLPSLPLKIIHLIWSWCLYCPFARRRRKFSLFYTYFIDFLNKNQVSWVKYFETFQGALFPGSSLGSKKTFFDCSYSLKKRCARA